MGQFHETAILKNGILPPSVKRLSLDVVHADWFWISSYPGF